MIRNYLKLYDTYGWIAIASLMVCGLTGVFLIVPFDPQNAYLSVTSFVTTNPAASLTRNMHYWSAQLFLIFTILHFIEHFGSSESLRLSSGEPKRIIKSGTWLRLVLTILVVFYVMLSGFILKDDADSRQAHLLLSSLLSSLPLVGNFLSGAIAGTSESLIVIYLHHAATATIIIFIVIFEHVRSIKVKWLTFVITSALIIALGFLFRAPLSQPDESVMKSPWFFVGVQEMLHLFSNPLLVVVILLTIIAVIYIVPFTGRKISRYLKYFIWMAFIVYAVFTVIGYFFRGQAYSFQVPFTDGSYYPVTLDWRPVSFKSDANNGLYEFEGRSEGCMSCHSGMKGLSLSHDPKIIGCYSCHGGDPFTLNADAAHRNMHKVPGNLQNAAETCGGSSCHDNITERVSGSMMATISGLISVDKWTFGESNTPSGYFHVNDLEDSPADTHLKNLCAGCHLGMEKTEHGTADWLDRGGGCNACHLTYNKNADNTLALLKKAGSSSGNNVKNARSSTGKKANASELNYHPSIDINVTNDKCESCHSRSGRISMSYAGWHESPLKAIPTGTDALKYKKLPDGRVFTKMPADVHHEAGMMCIDCHTSFEVMGDGKKYMHKEDAVKIQCEDCHTDNKDGIQGRALSETDRETQLIAWLRDINHNDPFILTTAKDTRPLVNTRYNKESGTSILIRKSDKKQLVMKPASAACSKHKAHNRLTCEACHTAWVPQCIGCHNTYEKETIGYDMLRKKERRGTWVEYTGDYLAEAPVLGLKETNKPAGSQKVGIFSPGMIMTIEHSLKDSEKHNTFHRLYAPVSGHTTVRESRSCVSCHLDPLALGYGRGKLHLSGKGKWTFEPMYVLNKHDNLPEDAWVGFLSERRDTSVTRLHMRPFNIKEQQRILLAGACLTCHEEGSSVINRCLSDLDGTIKQASKKCIIPGTQIR